jgi:hypothetical protein
MHSFACAAEAAVGLEAFRRCYNEERPQRKRNQ